MLALEVSESVMSGAGIDMVLDCVWARSDASYERRSDDRVRAATNLREMFG